MNDTTAANETNETMTGDPQRPAQFTAGQLYVWNGRRFVPLPPPDVAKLPVSDAAMEAVKRVRSEATRMLSDRPDLAVIASAMLIGAEDLPDLMERVRQYGERMYRAKAPA